jgi:hypothetical protein
MESAESSWSSLPPGFDFQRVHELKSEWGLCWKGDVAIAGESGAARSRRRANQSANKSAFAAAGKSAN